MDGLPRNKKPLNAAHEKQRIALDDYLFERKLQEVYDTKEKSNDLPKFVQKLSKSVKKYKAKATSALHKTPAQPKTSKKPKVQLIDAPHVPKKKFAKLTDHKAAKIPKQAKIKVKKQRKPIPKRVIFIGAGGIVLTVGIAGAIMLNQSSNKQDKPEVKAVSIETKPDFETLVPNRNAASKIKFDASKRVATYEDTIEDGRVVVSQQKLGETELKDEGFLRRTAINFNLKQEVTTKKGQAYIGANIDKNTQFAMFLYQDFLIFIQTEKTYKYQTLVDYIDDLQ